MFDELHSLKLAKINRDLINSSKGQEELKRFTDNQYLFQDGKIIWNHYIPIEILQAHYNETYIVDSEKFKKNGYGITQFRIYFDFRIFDIYCDGKHPNLDPKTNRFCVDTSVTFLEVTFENIENIVKPILSCINLNFSYYSILDQIKLKELL